MSHLVSGFASNPAYLCRMGQRLELERRKSGAGVRQGDRVEWNTPQGKTRGTVKRKLTSDTEVGGQRINASGRSRCLVERRAARRPPTKPTP